MIFPLCKTSMFNLFLMGMSSFPLLPCMFWCNPFWSPNGTRWTWILIHSQRDWCSIDVERSRNPGYFTDVELVGGFKHENMMFHFMSMRCHHSHWRCHISYFSRWAHCTTNQLNMWIFLDPASSSNDIAISDPRLSREYHASWGTAQTKSLRIDGQPWLTTSDDSTRIKHWPQALTVPEEVTFGPLVDGISAAATAGGFVVGGFATADFRASTQQCATGAASTQSCWGRKESRLWLVSVREKKYGKPMVSRGNHSIPSGNLT